ncbi:SMU1112c/YaeR family gloxylase I-like metalloprotein [Viscerimonas tarda]
MLKGIHHIAIICSDYKKSKDFYVNKLGFSVICETFRAERNSYKLDLSVGGNGQVELFSFDNPPERPSYPEARGLRHLAFATDDLEQEVAGLKARGIAVEPIRKDELTGCRFTFFGDPDGLPLELYELKEQKINK